MSYEDKAAVKEKLESIKAHNKRKLARHLKEHQGVEINSNSIFDIQIKRLHEYKRQQMNALYVIPNTLTSKLVTSLLVQSQSSLVVKQLQPTQSLKTLSI